MIFNELNAVIELLEKYQAKKKLSQEQKMLELTIMSMYYFGKQPGQKAVTGNGRYATTESELDTIKEFSKFDRFNAIKEGERLGLMKDCSSFNQREWYLTLDGVTYAEALLERVKS